MSKEIKSINLTQKIRVNEKNKKWMEQNFNSFDKYGIIYKGVSLLPLRDNKGNIQRKIIDDVDYGIKKTFLYK